MIGCGSMGSGLALLFAEHDVFVSIQDPSEDNVNNLLSQASRDGLYSRLSKHDSHASLCASLDTPRVIFLSTPHGTACDSVLENLQPYLEKGDVIVDCSNEDWT